MSPAAAAGRKAAASSAARLRQGLPLVLLVVGGSFGLGRLLAGKHELQDARNGEVVDLRRPVGKQAPRRKPEDLATEHERLRAHIDINKYVNKPVPKPLGWE